MGRMLKSPVGRSNTRGTISKQNGRQKRSQFNKKHTLNSTSTTQNPGSPFEDTITMSGGSKTYLKNLLQTKRIQLAKLVQGAMPQKLKDQGSFLLTNEYLKDSSLFLENNKSQFAPRLM